MGYIGFRLGLSAEFVKLAGLVVAFFVSCKYHGPMGTWVSGRSSMPPEWALPLTAVLLVVGVYFLVTKILRLFEKVVQVTFEQKVSKTGGLAVGLLRGLLTASVVLSILGELPSSYLTLSINRQSVSGRFVAQVAPAFYEAAAPRMSRFFSLWKGGQPKNVAR